MGPHATRQSALITLCTSSIGYVAQNSPEEILAALGRRYKATTKPSNLTIVFGAPPGGGKEKGINPLAQDGMVKRTIGSHYGQAAQLAAVEGANKIEAYNLPLGSLSRMIHAAASKLSWHVTDVGFGTMADPKLGGGKINKLTREDLVEEIEVRDSLTSAGQQSKSTLIAPIGQVLGKKYLIYKAAPNNVAVIRSSTTADPMGNITMERESVSTSSRP
jgi:propionate CoA-transferase